MGRLPGFDYKRPFFYMVTLKRLPQTRQPAKPGIAPARVFGRDSGASAPRILPFCAISPEGRVVPNAITEAFKAAIREWVRFWRSIESVLPHVIMPDHLHLLIKLAAVEKAVSLAVVVGDLRKRLNRAYWAVMSPADAGDCKTKVLPGGASAPPIFEREWHDWIVKKEGQLAAFRKYILENPMRHARRQANRQFFTRARRIEWRGTAYWAYGNETLLEQPVIVAIKGHRRPPETGVKLIGETGEPPKSSALMRGPELLAAASRIGPGGAGLSTFLSPLEKEAGNEIIKAGGALIVLSMQGFGERWHPTEKQERLCAAGRMLYLSPYAPQAAQLDKKEMHIRAHALVDWALEHSTNHLEAWP